MQRGFAPWCADSHILTSLESLSALTKMHNLSWTPGLEASRKDFHVWRPFTQTKYVSWLFHSHSPSSSGISKFYSSTVASLGSTVPRKA